MLKDKTIYLTAFQTGTLGLRSTTSRTKFEALNLNEKDYAEIIEKNKKTAANLDIVIESDICRFVVLPALNHYPEPDVVNFLAQQHLQRKYVDFDTNQFVIVYDQLKFNHPCLVVAFPKKQYQQFMQFESHFRIKSFLPSILAVWNYYQHVIIGNQLLIIEKQFAFLIDHAQGKIKEIDTFPVYLIGSLQFDYYLDLNSLIFSDLEQIASNTKMSLGSKKIIDLLQENHLDKSQALNMMRILS